jgi:hypothetical protein
VQITKIPRAELERYAREQYARQFGQAAPIKVRNAQALVALGEHRALKWRGHAYRVPPLPWKAGARLLVISQALTSEGERERATRLGRKVMHALVRLRSFGPWAKPVLNPFRRASSEEVSDLCDFFLHIPDDNKHDGGNATSVDLMDGLMEMVRLFPALIGVDGLPVSWSAYQYALRHFGRAQARDDLRAAQAARVSQAPKADWQNYAREMRSACGWN